MLASAAVAVLITAGCGRDAGSTAKVTAVEGSGGVTVTAAGMRFSVERIEVTAGTATTITLVNHDRLAHTLRVYASGDPEGDIAADTGEVAAGDAGEAVVLFASAGKHPFRCAIHPQQMRGTLVIR